ncbi:kinase-like domain-containing protein [Gongronella butleri]|nr:kinase-like domain-containing protein [Gongronella butleri]
MGLSPTARLIRFLSGLFSSAFANPKADDSEVSVRLAQFKLLRVIGRGAFGKVRMVEHRESRQLYAMKYIDKDECIKMDAVRNVIRERNILEQLDHPFLCRLRFAFQDDKSMYMISDLMLGGDLFYHLNPKHSFSEDVLRFWFAELSSAVKYLHAKHVVHRDIKPPNILLDERGHVHLTDFNVATILHRNRPLTSSSGTSFYMAPEVFRGGGYNEAVDWWGLGVTLYECVYNKKPFAQDSYDELSAAVRRGHVPYSNSKRSVSGELLSVMQGFLELSPSKRLGQGEQGWLQLLQHPFFRSIDWYQLECKQLPPPFTPPADQNNFDPTFDLEQMVLDDFSVPRRGHQHHQQHKNSKSGAASSSSAPVSKFDRDMQLIATKFKPFDFTIFEKYEGFKDPVKMTVGDPPDWVKPAFDGADRDHLPIKRISTGHPDPTGSGANAAIPPPPAVPSSSSFASSSSPAASMSTAAMAAATRHPALWRSSSVQNIAAAARAGASPSPSPMPVQDQMRKRRSLGYHQEAASHSASSVSSAVAISLSEEYALSLQGLRKKQSTRSFRERRERDRKTLAS